MTVDTLSALVAKWRKEAVEYRQAAQANTGSSYSEAAWARECLSDELSAALTSAPPTLTCDRCGAAHGYCWHTREGWQPIATAPKDGREVLLCIAGENEPHRYHASWREGRWWIEWTDGDNPVYGATHWQPLPDPPTPIPIQETT